MILTKWGSLGAKILLDHVKFMVDLWHCEKHKETTCMPPGNPDSLYHPHLPQFAEVKGVNTESTEQAFKWLGKYIHHKENDWTSILFLYLENDRTAQQKSERYV